MLEIMEVHFKSDVAISSVESLEMAGKGCGSGTSASSMAVRGCVQGSSGAGGCSVCSGAVLRQRRALRVLQL